MRTLQLQGMPHQEGLYRFPRPHSASLLQVCPFQLSVCIHSSHGKRGTGSGPSPQDLLSLHPLGQLFVEGISSHTCSLHRFHSANSRGAEAAGNITDFKTEGEPGSLCSPWPLLPFQVDCVCLKSHLSLKKAFMEAPNRTTSIASHPTH